MFKYSAPIFIGLIILTCVIYIRYLLFEDDAVYTFTDEKIVIKRKNRETSIEIIDIEEIVFNGNRFTFKDINNRRRLPWSDFYFIEIGLKNGNWIAITNVIHKDLLNIVRFKYPTIEYKTNWIFYPLMTMY